MKNNSFNEKVFNKNIASIVIKMIVVILMIIGVVESYDPTSKFMAKNPMLYFTIQSNITIGCVVAIFLVIQIIELIRKKPIPIPRWFYLISFSFTIAITLTFLVFWLFLAPTMVAKGFAKYLATGANICCHTLLPIFAVVNFLFFEDYRLVKKYDYLAGTAMPLYYFVFAMICIAKSVDFSSGFNAPYFFLDYSLLGWFTLSSPKVVNGAICGIGVFWWVIIIAVIVIGISYALNRIKNILYKKCLKKQLKLPVDEIIIENDD